MAGLADLLEAYKNYRGVQDWKLGQQMNRVPGAEEAMNLWGGWDTGGLAGAIKTYHGSPRAEPFTRFDSAHMGSGEGAQAFGKGHYLAERPGIAKSYAEMRGPMYEKSFKFGPANYEMFSRENLEQKLAAGGLLKKDEKLIQKILRKKVDPIEYMKDRIKILEEDTGLRYSWNSPYMAQLNLNKIDQYNRINPGFIQPGKIATRGPLRSLYEVSLEWPGARESVDPMSREHFFQWDKEFKNQPKHVKEALLDIAKNHPESVQSYLEFLIKHSVPGYPQHTAETLINMYPQSAIKESHGAVEKLLYERGVPGVAFLDQPSRTKPVPERTYNYVAFGDEIPRIISHNKPSVLDMLWPKK